MMTQCLPMSLTGIWGSDIAALLVSIGRAAAVFGAGSYLVGGAVRDALLGISSTDIDIMIEGDAGAFVEFLKREWLTYVAGISPPGKAVIYPRYRTAKLPLPPSSGLTFDCLDFSSARKEDYIQPGQSPLVKPGDLYADLARRDFTINAMAIDLTPESLGVLCDYFSGEAHLRARVLQILHPGSFNDDPARMLRGLRLIARLGFSFSAETDCAFQQARSLAYLRLLPPLRLFDELRKSLAEKPVLDVIETFEHFGILTQLGDLELGPSARAVIKELQDEREKSPANPNGGWMRAFCALTMHLRDEAFRGLLSHYQVQQKQLRELLRCRESLHARAS